MILSIGEILADIIMDQTTGEMHAYVGGAPFNVAVGAAKCGADVTFLGRTGVDPIGKFVKREAERFPLNAVIQTDERRPTTLAIVSINEEGERDFNFVRENAADYHVELDEEFVKSLSPKLIHVGSLMLSEYVGRELALKILALAKKLSVPVSFDVNYRADIFKNGKNAVECYKPLIDSADILKFSDDELELYSGEKAETAVDKLSNKIVCVTYGKKGSLVKFGNEKAFVDAVPVKPVDTTGAGDAFFGAFLAEIDKIGLDDLDMDKIVSITKFANKKGAEATLHKGAVIL